MSVDSTMLLFEGFLQKRKDSLKLWWVTYWFRLQNTTLFFFTEKNGGASHLRGYYYIHTVQSVREVDRFYMKRFIFEIIMTNGKRKVLAAETAALRKEWVEHLWRAMQLSSSLFSVNTDTHPEEDKQQNPSQSNTLESSGEHPDKLPNTSDTDSGGELVPSRRFSAPNPLDTDQEASTETSPDELYRVVNIDPPVVCNQENTTDDGLDKDTQGLYDVLPCRNEIRALETSAETEVIYDSPASYRNFVACEDLTENIYDVPSNLLRNAPTIGDQLEE